MSPSTDTSQAAPAPTKPRARSMRLMRNMPIGKKMAVVVGAMVLPLLALLGLYAWSQYKGLTFIDQEIDGLAYYHPLEEIGGEIDLRAEKLASALSSSTKPDLSAIDAGIDQLMDEMDAADKRHGRPASHALWTEVQASWSKLKGANFTGFDESLEAHEALVRQISHLRTHISTEWGMALDPEAQTFFLLDITVNSIPEIENSVGALRSMIAAGENGAASSADLRMEMIRHAAVTDDRISEIEDTLKVIKAKTAGNAQAAAVFAEMDTTWNKTLEGWTAAVGMLASEGRTASADYKALSDRGDALPDQIGKVHDQMMKVTTLLLAERRHDLLVQMIVGISLVLLLCAIAVKLSHAVS